MADRHGHDMRYAIDPEKAGRDLGWQPVTSFEEEIVKTIEWYRSEKGKWLQECVDSEAEWLKANYEQRK